LDSKGVWENELVAVSDASVENDEIAIEDETLFEEGKYGGEPAAKIRDETVEKCRLVLANKAFILYDKLPLEGLLPVSGGVLGIFDIKRAGGMSKLE